MIAEHYGLDILVLICITSYLVFFILQAIMDHNDPDNHMK